MNTITRTVLVFFGSLLALVLLMGLTSMFQPTTPRPSSVPIATTSISTPSASFSFGGTNSQPSEQIASAMVSLAKAEVTKLTQEPADRIIVTSAEAIDWPNTALGCGLEGHLYAQVVTPGYKIVLQTQTEAFEYHTDSSENVVLCKSSPLSN